MCITNASLANITNFTLAHVWENSLGKQQQQQQKHKWKKKKKKNTNFTSGVGCAPSSISTSSSNKQHSSSLNPNDSLLGPAVDLHLVSDSVVSYVVLCRLIALLLSHSRSIWRCALPDVSKRSLAYPWLSCQWVFLSEDEPPALMSLPHAIALRFCQPINQFGCSQK